MLMMRDKLLKIIIFCVSFLNPLLNVSFIIIVTLQYEKIKLKNNRGMIDLIMPSYGFAIIEINKNILILRS